MALAAIDRPTTAPVSAPARDTLLFGGRLQRLLAEYRAAVAKVAPDDMRFTQYLILDALSRRDKPSQTDLVHATGTDRSTLADVMRRMNKRGWIIRKRLKDDLRTYATQMTKPGEAALAKARKVIAPIDRAFEREASSKLFGLPR